MKNKTETCSGRLVLHFGEWIVRSGYGTFPLAKELQNKPDANTGSNGAFVEATVTHGQVTDYHFASEQI